MIVLRKDHRGVDIISAAIRSAVLWRAERDQQRNWIRATSRATHTMPWFAFTTKLATWSRHTSTGAISRGR